MTDQMGRAWREVTADEVGLGERVYVRCAGGCLWRFDEHLVGVAATASSAAGVEAFVPSFMALARSSLGPFDIVSDVSRVIVDVGNADVLAASSSMFPRLQEAFANKVRRQAGVIAKHWAAPFWKSINLAAGAPWPVEVFFEPPEAWAWLGVDAATRAEIEALVEALLSTPDLGAAVGAALRADPAMGLGDVARVVGQSVRSLQRALAAEGKTFATLRNDIRLERALVLLGRDMKLEAIASAIGFASTSHFSAWFRRLRGVTPSQLREAR